jgi:Cu(I)/Ag(I) efflux system membrane protein CusA/SilA
MPNYTRINLFFPVTFELIYRPKAMTVAMIIAGLLPIMQGDDAGSEVMQRIAAPMLSLFVVPAIYLVWKRKEVI